MKKMFTQTPALMILTYIIAQFLPAIFLLFTPPEYLTTVSVYGTLFSFIAGALAMLLLNRRSTIRNSITQDASKPLTKVLFWGAAGMVLALLAQQAAYMIESSLLGIPAESANTEGLLVITQSYPLFMIVISIAGPIMEEFVFRKVIFGSLYDIIGSVGAAVVSSLIFAFIHLDSHILLYSSMGFVFCYLYYKTKNIAAPILAHTLMNTIVLLVNFAV